MEVFGIRSRRAIVPGAVLAILGIAAVILGSRYFHPVPSKDQVAQANTVAEAVKAFYAAKGCYPQPTAQFGKPPSAIVRYLHATTMPSYLQYVVANAKNEWVSGIGTSAYIVYINYQPGDARANIYLAGSAGANGPMPSPTAVKLCRPWSQIDAAEVAQANTVARAVRALYAVKGCYPRPTAVFGQPPSAIAPYLHATTMPSYLQYVAANAKNEWVSGSDASAYLIYINYHRGDPVANVYVIGSAGTNGPVPSPTKVKLC